MAMRPRAETLEALLAERLRRSDTRTTEVERHSGETKASLLPRTVQAEQRIEAQQAEISAQAGHITSLGQRMGSAESEISAQAGHITSLGQRMGSAESAIGQHSAFINDLGNRMVGVESQAATAAGTAAAAQATANRADSSARILAQHATALRNYMVEQGMNPPPPPIIPST